MKKTILVAILAAFTFASCEDTTKKDTNTPDSDTAVLKDENHDGEEDH